MNPPVELLEKLQAYAYSGSLGAFAALVGYLYQIIKYPANRVTVFMVFATITIGFYMGVVVGGFIPESWENRDAVLLLAGATGLKGFEILTEWARTALPTLLRVWLQGQNPRPPGDQ